MGQRHNRRRTRPRSRNQSQSRTVSLNEQQQQHSVSEPVFLAPLAHTRHNSWLPEWQSFEYYDRQPPRHSGRPEFAMQQYRFFGEEPGDDDAHLYYNMLDYFGRLDYIDT